MIKILNKGKEEKKEKVLKGFKVHCNKCGCDFIIGLEDTYKVIGMTFWEYAWNCPWCKAEHETGQGGYNGKTEYLYEE